MFISNSGEVKNEEKLVHRLSQMLYRGQRAFCLLGPPSLRLPCT